MTPAHQPFAADRTAGLSGTLRLARGQPRERAIEPDCIVRIHADEPDRKADLVMPIQGLGNDSDPAFRRQIEAQRQPDARFLRMHRGDEAAAAAQVVDADRRFERFDPEAVEWPGETLMDTTIGDRRQGSIGRLRAGGRFAHRITICCGAAGLRWAARFRIPRLAARSPGPARLPE